MFTDKCIAEINKIVFDHKNNRIKSIQLADVIITLKINMLDHIKANPGYSACSFNAWDFIAKAVNKHHGFTVLEIGEWRKAWDRAQKRADGEMGLMTIEI